MEVESCRSVFSVALLNNPFDMICKAYKRVHEVFIIIVSPVGCSGGWWPSNAT